MKRSTYIQLSPLGLHIKATVAMIGVFAFLQVYSIQAILPRLVTQLGISEVTAGMMVGATVLGIAVMSPVTGMLSEIYGRKSLIVFSMLLLAVPTCMLGFVDDAKLMLLLRFIQGLTIPSMTVVTLAYCSEEFAEHQLAELSAFFISGTVLGGFLGRFILGHLDDMLGWRVAIILMGCMTFLGGLFIAHKLPQSRNFTPQKHKNNTFHEITQHTQNTRFLVACFLGFCILFSLIGCFTFINLYLSEQPYLLGSADLANLFSIYLIGVFVTPLTVRLMNRVGAINTILIALFMSAVGLCITMTAALFFVIVGLTLTSTGIFITQSAIVKHIMSSITHGRALATGFYYMCYYMGGSLGAWGCGIAYTYAQWYGVIAVLVTMKLAAIAVTMHYMKDA